MYQVDKIVNLPYAPHKECLLDFYIPRTNAPCPVLIFFHGGGLESGERKDETVLIQLAEKYGIAVATADYRMYPQARFPDFAEDSADAVSYVFRYNREHKLFSRYYAGGSSAGAYLAMLLFFNRALLEGRGIRPEDISGYLFDAGQPTTHFNVLRERGLDPRSIRVDEAAPLYYLDRDYPYREKQPRILILYSDQDMVNRLEQNELLYRTMEHFQYDMGRVDKRCMEGYPHTGYYGAVKSDGSYLLPELYADFILNKIRTGNS